MTLQAGLVLPDKPIAEICRRYGVRELSVFGSASRGEMRTDSDIDLLVDFAPDSSSGMFEFVAMEQELSTLLGRRVDLVSKNGLKPRVKPNVLRDARVVYAG